MLRVYSTQKKRVAFNVSKMLSGQGPEGEVGSTYYYFLGVHMCVMCAHMSEFSVCVYMQVQVRIQECAHTCYSVLMKARSQFAQCTV